MASGTKTYSAAAQTHQVRAHGMRESQFDVSGVFVGTLVAEWSPDGGTTWYVLPILKQDGTIVQSVTAAGTYYLHYIPTSATDIRSRCSAYTSGSPVATFTTR